MRNTKKRRPSEVLLQLMRYAWDPTFQAEDLEVDMGEAMEVYRATVEMEARAAPAPAPRRKPGRKPQGAADEMPADETEGTQ